MDDGHKTSAQDVMENPSLEEQGELMVDVAASPGALYSGQSRHAQNIPMKLRTFLDVMAAKACLPVRTCGSSLP